MTVRSLYFTGPSEVAVRERSRPSPGPDELLVESERSAISSGTELLVYRGETEPSMAADETLDALSGTFEYPLRYGYAVVGRVVEAGANVADWADERVFAFNPHESHFLADPDEVVRVPSGMSAERAVFLANTEAAVNFVMDGRPMVGERVCVFGQGVVGLLTTGLLAEFPLDALVTVEPHDGRRELSAELGATALDSEGAAREALADEHVDGADLTYELSGNPRALDAALDATGYAGRVVVGSWYGTKPVPLSLDGQFHRSHVRLRASQVSRIDPDHEGRWDKSRRFETVRDALDRLEPERFVTHRLPVEHADEAYRLLDDHPEEAVQVLLTYP
ncbi:zinc-dependent alcohol dehydrogenase [Halomarina ordinaria]|uniref:Zinc-binding dehydrogenase n=1 Tax=Halomarina ordinaria TaxID=3033939 RepID=A0ABD5UB04_9EURY|nr:zinc-binding dehydrogenase [Halomarina sp. PSRA2]